MIIEQPSAYLTPGYPEIYDAFTSQVSGNFHHHLPTIFEVVAEHHSCPKPTHVLDLGCGTGLASLPFLRQDVKVHSVDVSLPMLEQFRQKVSRLPAKTRRLSSTQLVSSTEEWSIGKEGPYDLAMAVYNTINCIPDPEAVRNLFTQSRAVIKNSGLFVFDVLTLESFNRMRIPRNLKFRWRGLDMEATYRISRGDGETFTDYLRIDGPAELCRTFCTVRRFYELSYLTDLLQACGWSKVDVYAAFTLNKVRIDNPAGAWMFVARP